MLPSALLTASAYAISTDFGAESSRPASLLCTLRTHQSPGEWQHSLPACSLALAGRDFHPLDFFKWFPPPSLLVSPPPRFSQRDSWKLPPDDGLCTGLVPGCRRYARNVPGANGNSTDGAPFLDVFANLVFKSRYLKPSPHQFPPLTFGLSKRICRTARYPDGQ